MDRLQQLEKIQNECKQVFEKMSRFTNISKKGLEISVSDETLKDTLMDLHNYAAMAIMCMEDEISI